MSNIAIELVVFKIKPGVSNEAFKEAAAKTIPVLQNMDGFLGRTLAVTETGDQWTDIVYWKDMDSAQKAAKAFGKELDCQEFISMLDSEQMTFLHLKPVFSSEKK